MVEVLKGLVSGDALEVEYARRCENHDQKTITGKTVDILNGKVALEQEEGWSVKRRLKRSVVLKKPKPTDVWVEDRLWSLFKALGFQEMNANRQFMITELAGTKRQVDIFAKDVETVFVVECTHLKQPGSRTMKTLIDKINGYRHDVITAIHKHYGMDPKLKVKFAIATSNILWNNEDKDRASKNKIAVITEADIEYYENLHHLLKDAAKFNFLGRYLNGEKVEGLQLELPATRGRAGGRTFYNFLISPHHLLRIGYVNHRVNNSNDDLETYQRMVKPSRLKEIGQYLDEGGKFPTNIIINFKSDSELQFQPRQKFGDTATGMLTLPGLFGCAWIIDGQHRLYGYAYAKRSVANEHSVVSVLAYENLPLKEEIRMFIDINTKQVKIRRGLVDEIVSGLNVDDQDHVNRLQALYANLALRLEKNPTSPLHKRINITGTEKTSYRCITSPSISDQSESANLLGKASRSTKSKPATFELGPLADPSGDSRAIIEKATATLSLYFGLFAHRLRSHWDLGDAKGGYLCTNNGLRPLIVLLAKIIEFIEQRKNVRALNMSAAEIVERVQPYMEPLIEFFRTADPFMVAAFRNRGSSLKTVDDNCFQMMTIISESISHFTTRDLEAFKGNRDAKGTQEAKLLIAEVNSIIFENVIATLQDAYGSDEKDWWMKGVPPAIRKKCDNKFNLTDGSSGRWRQLSFENYPDIILWPDNWELFKDNYNLDGRRKRTDAVSWIDRINKAKAITDHAERGPLSPQQVDFVKRVHGLVKKHIEEEQKLDGKTRLLTDDAEAEPVLADVA